MKNNIAPGLCVIWVLSGCTATNKYKGPNYTFDDLDYSTTILPKPIPINAEYTVTQNCSEAHSVHSPLIWLLVAGPIIVLLLVPSPTELSSSDAWSILSLIGPPITYINGRQNCVYYNLAFADPSPTPKLETTIPSALVKEAITISDQNCYAYQHILTSGFNELDANQKFLSDAATMNQTGAAFASPVAGAVIGGLKQVVTSANDAIKTSFFINYGAPQLFENIGTVRKVLITELTTSSPPMWGCSPAGMSYADLRQFMKVYDKSCFFEQAVSDLNLTTDQGQATVQSTGLSGQAIRRDILTNNNANPVQ